METDILVIGGGIAGLSFAIKVARQRPDLQITVLTKTVENESNTRYAQGGVAAVWDYAKDSFDKHVEDTLDAGAGLCHRDIVEIVVTEGPERVREIIDWGTRFDKNSEGAEYDLGREGGHTENRILHYKDLTGWEIQRALVSETKHHPNIIIHEHYYAVDIITQHHLGHVVNRVTPDITCYGCYALNKQTSKIETFVAKITLMATGGIGQVYKNTTNPVIATGDGIAMFYRAKGRVENMEFVQFHPTALYNPSGENPNFLISEAVRGFGAILRTPEGNEFMQKYDARLSLAPRDIVARAIDNEMKVIGSEFMYLDCRHIDKDKFYAHFPTIYDKCMTLGIDPMRDMIPVVPACHYMCGGILVDAKGRTSIQNIFACGECSCTGLHGANRLASNSLLEALVFAHHIAEETLLTIATKDFQKGIPDWNASGTTQPQEMILITQTTKELKDIMSYYVGIVRSNIRLKRALDRLFILYGETEELYNTTTLSPQLCEMRNLITMGYLIARSASVRKESRGLHYTTDYPNQLNFIQDTIL